MPKQLSSKLMLLAGEPTFFCPGCNMLHMVNVNEANQVTGAIWDWDEDPEKPTFWPSLHIKVNGKTKCHSFITDGVIKYLEDCDHRLAGANVPMHAIPEDDY